jgi:hypothetical protein
VSLTMATRDRRSHAACAFNHAVKLTDIRPPKQVGGGPCILDRSLRTMRRNYFSELLIEVNLVLSFEPNPFTAAITARAMPAAIRPYSMAVAAVSSFKNLEMVFTPVLPRYSVQTIRSG